MNNERMIRAARLLMNFTDGENLDADFITFIINWQLKRKLTADGTLNNSTWQQIAKEAPTCSTAKGTKNAIKALQILLTGLTVDGIFGEKTKAAVTAFQASAGLVTDGICGQKTWAALVKTLSTEQQPSNSVQLPISKFVQPVDYKQGDTRWKKNMYSNHNDKSQTMSNSGCGPTAMADIVATLKDKNITPWTLAQKAMAWGDRTYNSGTAWTFFEHIAKEYKFTKFIQTASGSVLKNCLDAGGYAVCSMGPGYWTNGGHFICAWKYDGEYIYCNDPASSTRVRQTISNFMAQRKQFFCFYPDEPIIGDDSDKEKKTEPVVDNRKIIDISAWDGNIDFDKLQKEVSFVIARVTCGSDKDKNFDKYAAELNNRNIPFGVYCYSYADTEGKAQDEAKKMFAAAKKYNPKFYVLDAEEERIKSNTILAFAKTCRDLGIERLGCYVAHHRYTQYSFGTLRPQFDFVWIPRYGNNDGTIDGSKQPSYPCDLWQYTDKGHITGIDGEVDLNVITGSGKNLSWFQGGDI